MTTSPRQNLIGNLHRIQNKQFILFFSAYLCGNSLMRRSEVSFTSKSFRGSMTAEDLAKRTDLSQTGMGKGLRTSFAEEEVIFFPAKEEAQFRVDTFTDKNTKKKTPTISLWVITDRQGWVCLPLAIFRHTPSKEEELVLFREDNEFGCQLAPAVLSDLEVAEKLFGTQIQVTEVMKASVPLFNFEAGKYSLKRDADGKVCYDPEAKSTCYKFSEVENE